MNVFVSHGTQDTWIARQMARCIGDTGASTFIDAYDIRVGDQFENAIVNAIERADELVGLVTAISAQRAWLHQEIGIARGLRKRICCVLYGITLTQLERAGGTGILSNRDVVQLNDFDRYVAELRMR